MNTDTEQSVLLSGDGNIAVFSDNFRPKIDGVSIAVELLLREFERRGQLYDLFTIEWPGEYQDPKNVFRFRSIESWIDSNIRLSVPLNPRYLQRLIQTPYCLLHSHLPGATGFLAEGIAEIRQLPHFHTFHTYFRDYRHYIKMLGYEPSPELMDKLACWWANRADFLIAPTEKIRNWLNSLGVDVEMRVIPSGLDLTDFVAKNKDKSYLVERGFVESGDFVLLYVGRLAKEKAVDELIVNFTHALEFIKQARGDFRQIKLVIVGDGSARGELEELVRARGLEKAVIFTGFIDSREIHRVYHAADVFVFLSTSETQGLVVVEAMASGLPLLLAEDEAYTEMIDERQNGFVIRMRGDFVDAVRYLIDKPALCEEQGEKSRAKAGRFDIRRTTDELVKYYQYGVEKWQQTRKRRVYETVGFGPKKVMEKINGLKSEVGRLFNNHV